MSLPPGDQPRVCYQLVHQWGEHPRAVRSLPDWPAVVHHLTHMTPPLLGEQVTVSTVQAPVTLAEVEAAIARLVEADGLAVRTQAAAALGLLRQYQKNQPPPAGR